MSRVRAFGRVVLFSLGVGFLTGCHTYRVVDEPPIGSVVRVSLPVTTPLSSIAQTVSVEGQLLEVGDTIALATETRRSLGAYRDLVQFDTVRLAASQTSSLEVKEFSTRRSVVLGVAIAGGAAFGAAVGFGLVGGAFGSDPTPPPPVSTVVSRSLVSAIWGLLVR